MTGTTPPSSQAGSDFRTTKAYDLLAASPLMVWYGFASAGLWPQIRDAFARGSASGTAPDLLSAIALSITLAFLLLQIVLFMVRTLPTRYSQSWPERIVAMVGANLGLAYLLLPRAPMGTATAIAASSLTILGTAGSIWALAHLGRAFSLLPQARRLVTSGPYRIVLHPLYLTELIANLGVMLQFRQPWSLLIAFVTLAVQVPRMHYEERVLSATFPDYEAYRRGRYRLFPGIY